MIENLYSDIEKDDTKMRFIRAVILGFDNGAIPGETIYIKNQKKADVKKQMDLMNFPHNL